MNAVKLLHVIDLVGVGVFAISGALAAGRRRLDLLGVVVIATVTAIGGGTIRDLLLDRPVFWIGEPIYLMVTFAAALLTVPYVRYASPPEKFLQAADALGLGLFTVAGAQVAQQLGVHGLIVVVMGVVTGVVGGVVRDVLCNEIPMILRRGNLYAAAAAAGAALYVMLGQLGVARLPASVCGMALIVALRAASIAFNWMLPVFHLPKRRS
jgi:uncharacterized membrane protein YeiH